MKNRIIKIAKSVKKKYIGVFRFVLKLGKYEWELDEGTNNLLLNFVDFISLMVYCGLSGYNVIKTFDITKPPSYLMFMLNVANLMRYFISNKIIIRDAKNKFVADHKEVLREDVNVASTTFRIISESLCLCISLVFILLGRGFNIDLFGIPSVSVVAVVSVAIVFFTALEEIISIGINMFKAKPKIYTVSQEGGE